MENTDLFEKIIARADKDNLDKNHDLRLKAIAFNEASKIILNSEEAPDFKHFLSTWAKARIAWCKYSGEPLV